MSGSSPQDSKCRRSCLDFLFWGRPEDLRLRRSREQVVGDGRVGAQQVRAETGRGLVRHLHAVLEDLAPLREVGRAATVTAEVGDLRRYH